MRHCVAGEMAVEACALVIQRAQNAFGATAQYVPKTPAGDVPMDKDKKAIY